MSVVKTDDGTVLIFTLEIFHGGNPLFNTCDKETWYYKRNKFWFF